jgi:hypothetical protein
LSQAHSNYQADITRLALSNGGASLLLFLLALLIRFLAMSLSDNEDGDAMARILYSRALVDHGDLVPSTVWLPGHFFFLAIPYFLGIGTEKAAIALTLFVSALTIPITFYLVLDRLGRSAAILAALLLAVYSLHIRFSVMTVAEGPFFTFILLGIVLFFSHLKTRSVWSLIAGTSSFNVASSMRFEGWVIPVFLAAAHLTSEWRSGKRLISRDLAHMAGFLIGTLAFPLLWSLYCYLQFGDALFFQHQTVADNALYFKNHARSLITRWRFSRRSPCFRWVRWRHPQLSDYSCHYGGQQSHERSRGSP